MSHRSFLLAVAAAMALSIFMALAATPYGIGVTPDSVVYLRAAESLRDGTGLPVPAYDGALVPLTHFPPLYPATLAGLATLGLEPLQAARWTALLMAAANILAFAFSAYRFTGSRAASTAVCFMLALSVDMLFLNTAVWSEAEFIFFAVVSLLCLTRYLEGRGFRYLAAGALAAALAWLARYAGGALIATGIVALAALGPGGIRRRLVDAALFGAIASAPGVAWMLRNLSLGGSLTDRTVLATRDPVGDMAALFQTVCSWLLPGTNRIEVIPWQSWLVAVCVLAVGVATVYALVRWVTPAIDGRAALIQTPVIFLLFGLVYTGSVLVAALQLRLGSDGQPRARASLRHRCARGRVDRACGASTRARTDSFDSGLKARRPACCSSTLSWRQEPSCISERRVEDSSAPSGRYPLVQRALADVADGGVVSRTTPAPSISGWVGGRATSRLTHCRLLSPAMARPRSWTPRVLAATPHAAPAR